LKDNELRAVSAITLTNLSKSYGDSVALRDLTLRVEDGEFLTLLGPSGSGKSTALMLIAGLTAPSSGSIHLGERDVTTLAPALRNIGLVFQSYALFPHLSVQENVAFALKVRNAAADETQRRVDEVLGLLRLRGLEARKPAQLSGGQQQRVALARALVFRPDILLLDEPMGALDRQLREEVQVELRRLQRSLGTTTILVTHDQEEALSLSDRILVLSEGRMQQVGAPKEIYMRPQSAFVAAFLGAANFLAGVVRDKGTHKVLELGDGQELPLAAPGHRSGASVKAMLRPERAQLAQAGAGQFGLEGRVLDAIYFGQGVRYLVETQPQQIFVVNSTDKEVRFAPGDAVQLLWAAADVWVLPEPASPGSSL
jgi:putative spermidine/putrescine transport system ATP-binding protein